VVRVALATLVASGVGLAARPGPARAQPSGGVLAECAALSPLLDDIHACLDDYLVVMDERLAEIGTLVDRTLDGEARTAFVLSQRAFATFRRDNCLWYLAFSTPRNEAEQIAKGCLATMSLERLTELQRLLTENGGDAPKSGYYVYGAERNTFRPCGSEARYWVEGNVAVVGELQQRYLEVAADDLQVLFASLGGTLEDGVTAPDGHVGVFRANVLLELRVPREGDCRLPGGGPSLAGENLVVATPEPEPSGSVVVAESPVAEPAAGGEPEQQLLAYFGAWLADCMENGGSRGCVLSTTFDGGAVAAGAALELANGLETVVPVLSLIRSDGERTALELAFPGREVDSPTKLRWGIDGDVFGDVVGSTIRVDERATRQIVEPSAYLDNELLPLMIDGGELVVDVLETVDDESGERYRATLVGLTRALAFADDFVGEGDGL